MIVPSHAEVTAPFPLETAIDAESVEMIAAGRSSGDDLRGEIAVHR